MPVSVDIARRVSRSVFVLVMFVMAVPMSVLKQLMCVIVVMSLGPMDVHSHCHQGAGDQQQE
jgi:hypothetical protein